MQSGNTRSDANLLLTMNPKKGTILMTSVPRDYYVDLPCVEDGGCPVGSKDKLTHTGLYGIKRKILLCFMQNVTILFI